MKHCSNEIKQQSINQSFYLQTYSKSTIFRILILFLVRIPIINHDLNSLFCTNDQCVNIVLWSVK